MTSSPLDCWWGHTRKRGGVGAWESRRGYTFVHTECSLWKYLLCKQNSQLFHFGLDVHPIECVLCSYFIYVYVQKSIPIEIVGPVQPAGYEESFYISILHHSPDENQFLNFPFAIIFHFPKWQPVESTFICHNTGSTWHPRPLDPSARQALPSFSIKSNGRQEILNWSSILTWMLPQPIKNESSIHMPKKYHHMNNKSRDLCPVTLPRFWLLT